MRATRLIVLLPAALLLCSCEYVRMLRPGVLRQLNPDVVRLVNYLPEVDDPNKATVARLFAHGGLSRARTDGDGVMRDRVHVPENEFIWRPAVIVMPRAGVLELEFHNEDIHGHAALVPSNGQRMHLVLPKHRAGVVRLELDQPGLYWFGCPVSNHAGRGMLGVIIVEGETPPEGRLDRPPQRRPRG